MRNLLVLTALLSPQEDPAARARALVERLRSERVEERAEAERALGELGDRALPALREAAGDRDPEVAGRARRLVHLIPVRRLLTPALRRAVPDAEDLLSGGDPKAWTALFLRAFPRGDPPFDSRERHPGLSAEDVGPLVPMALAHASKEQEGEVWNLAANGWAEGAPAGDLVGGLRHEQPRIRQLSAEALGTRAVRAAAPAIAGLLGDRDGDVRAAAFWALVRLRAKENVPAILRLSEDGLSESYLDGLVRLKVVEAVPELAVRLRASRGAARLPILEALSRLSGPAGAPSAEALLDDPDPRLRKEAAAALGRMGARGSAGKVRVLLEDPDRDVREAAARVLGELGSRESVSALVGRLEDPDGWVVSASLRSLAALGAREAGPKILQILGTPKSGLRRAAAEAAGTLGLQEAEPGLRRLLEDTESNGRWEAGCAVATLALARGEEAARALLRESGEQLVVCALAVFEEARAPGVRDDVVRLLGDRRDTVRRTALSALAAWGEEAARPHLVRALSDADSFARDDAIEALLPIAGEEEIPAFLKLLADPSRDARVGAASWLCSRGRREGVPVLLADSAPFALNALRRPKAWERLKARPSAGGKEGVGDVALAAEMPLLFPDGVPRSPNKKILDLVPRRKARNLLDALREAEGDDQRCVLEEDRIVVLDSWKAKEFWSGWWASESRK